jgi:hypothetical protein
MNSSPFNQKYFNITPETFVMPKDYSNFATFCVQERERDEDPIYIVKPSASSRGRGIFIIRNFTEVNPHDAYVVQKYIKNPLLIDGYKFDMRIYVLVTSFQPLEVFLYREGFARFGSELFTLQHDE